MSSIAMFVCMFALLCGRIGRAVQGSAVAVAAGTLVAVAAVDWNVHIVAISYVCQHDVVGALHFRILGFLRPSSRAPAVERLDPARCVLHARCEARRGAAVLRSVALRHACQFEVCALRNQEALWHAWKTGEVCAVRNQEVVIHAWNADV